MDSGDKPLLPTPEQAFLLINVSRSFGFEMIRKGELPSIKIGRCRRIPRAALLAWIEERTEEALDATGVA